jgi:formate-dependent nitrite reductase membrane component NrfD
MVSGYLVTKAIAGGTIMVAALLVLLGHADEQAAVGLAPPVVAGAFLAATGALLVGDLKQPGRFAYLLTRSNRSSWLVKGAYVLSAFALVCALWFVAGLADVDSVITILAIPGAALGASTAGYTAFLFAQCEGRDLWQTPLLLPLLIARAVVAGAAAYLVVGLFIDVPSERAILWTLLGGIAAIAFLTAVEVASHGSRHVELAVRSMVSGRHRSLFWSGVLAGVVIPAVLVILALSLDSTSAAIVIPAAATALIGMFAAESAFVRAGQSVPLS